MGTEKIRAGMLLVWLVFGLELCVAGIVRLAVGPSILLAPLVIGLHVVFMLAYIVHLPRYLVPPMAVAFALRGMAAIYDCATLTLTQLQTDSISYYSYAVLIATGRQINMTNIPILMYPRLLSLVLRCTGPSRGIAEYVNVLLGMTTIWLLYLTLRSIGAGIPTRKRFLWLLAVFPFSIVNSCTTYRECIMCTLVAASAYFALQWYKKRQPRSMICCIACILFASSFHAGVIVMSVGYAVLFAMYSHKEKKYAVNRRTVPVVLLAAVLAVAVIVAFPNVFLDKLKGAANTELLVDYANIKMGRSAYLKSLTVQSIGGIILTLPIRIFYFLFAPLPWNCRNMTDVTVFFVDGLVYMLCVVYVCRHYKNSAYKNLLFALVLGWLLTAAVFGVGTFNFGTAVRHRNKIFAVLLIIAALAGQRAPQSGSADGKTA